MNLVCGATGLIGGLAIDHLRRLQAPARAMVRASERVAEFEQRGVDVVLADFDRPASLPNALRDVEAVLLVSPSNPDMVRQQCAMVEAIVAAGPPFPHIVKVSGFLTAIDSASQSGRWHAQIEAESARHQLPLTSLRPPFFMQNLLRLAAGVKEESVIRNAVGLARIAMVDARDIAAVAAHCLLDPGQIGASHVITGPRAVTFADVASECSRIVGRHIRFETRGLAAESEIHRRAGTPEWRIRVLEEFQRGFIGGEGEFVTPVVEQLTGTRAISLAAFIGDHRAAFGAS